MTTASDQVMGASDRGVPVQENRSIGELMSAVTRDTSVLLRQEVELAKAELSDSARKAGKGAGLLSGAGVAGFLAVLFLSIAAWWGLGLVMGNAWSAVVVALIWGIVAAVLASSGRKELNRVRGLPKTVETVSKIPNALKGNEEDNR